MAAFEWTVVGLILFGMVVPFWMMTAVTFLVLKEGRVKAKTKGGGNVHDYTRLMQDFNDLLKGGNGKFNGPAFIAYLRELRDYPHYRDASLLFLEEVSITGSNKFDDVCRTELKLVETYLLGLNDD